MAGSSAPLRRLGAELRRLREAAGRTQVDVGQAIGRTHATFVNWERGKTKISKSDLVCLLAELGTPPDIRKALEDLRVEASQGANGQWATYELPGWLRPLVSFEQDAKLFATYEPSIIPGLLQTEQYARAVNSDSPYKADPSHVERWTQARMERQRRLTGPRPLKLQAVISESVLRTEAGTRAVLTGQLDRLLAASRARNITIQVLPSTEGGRAPTYTGFSVLHFPDRESDPPLGYFDSPLQGHFVHDEGDVLTMIKMFDQLRKIALSPSASAELLAAILQQRRGEDGEDARTEHGHVVQVQFQRTQR